MKTSPDVEGIRKWVSEMADGRSFHIQELIYHKDSIDECEAYETLLDLSKYKINVFYRRNNLFECETHRFIVVLILINDVFDNTFADDCYHTANQVVPILKLKPNVRAANHLRFCSCNHFPTSVTHSFGCLKINTCKHCRHGHSIPPINQFKISNSTKPYYSDLESSLKEKCFIIADKASEIVKQFCPLAFKNMSQNLSTSTCGIGHCLPLIFGGCSIVSDYTAHRHFDNNNVDNGLTGLVTFKNPSLDCNEIFQVHILPNYTVPGALGKKGVGFYLPHNSLALGVARKERHATFNLRPPCTQNASRTAYVLFQHAFLDKPDHG